MKSHSRFLATSFILMIFSLGGCTDSPDPEMQQYYSDVAKINSKFEKLLGTLSTDSRGVNPGKINPQSIKFKKPDEKALKDLRLLMSAAGEQMSRIKAPSVVAEEHAQATAKWNSGFSLDRNDFVCSGTKCYCGGAADCNEMFDTPWACDFDESWPPKCAEHFNVCSCVRPVCC